MKSTVRYARNLSPDAWLIPEISVEQLLDVIRRMEGTWSYFSEIGIPDDKTVFRSSHHLNRTKWDPKESLAINQVGFHCATGGAFRNVWSITAWFNCGDRSFDYITVPREDDPDDEDSFWRFRDTWFAEDITKISLSSFEEKESFEDDIRSFFALFHEAEMKISNPMDWEPGGLRAKVLCNCGHSKTIPAANLLSGKVCDNIFMLEKKLSCSSCGSVGRAKILPLFADSTVTHINRSRRYFDRALYNSTEPRHRFDHAEDLYEVMGGDGENDIYLGDGLSVSPDGSISGD